MINHPSPLRIVAAAGVALLAVVLAGCRTEGRTTDLSGPVTRELSVLVSAQNGLYYPPFLRNQPAGPEDNSYAVRIRSLLGDQPQLSLGEKTAVFFHDEAVAASPLWGRMWLAPLTKAGSPGLLGDSDIAAVRAMRTPNGWFHDADSPDPDTPEARASATVAGLEVLRSKAPIAGDDRRVTLAWLQAAAEAGPTPVVGGALAGSFRLLDAPVPPVLTAGFRPPTAKFTEARGQARYQLLLDAYGYATAVESA